jgi:hypothetical protein
MQKDAQILAAVCKMAQKSVDESARKQWVAVEQAPI